MSRTIDQAQHTIETIRARRQAWTEALGIDEAAAAGAPKSGNSSSEERDPIRAHAALIALEPRYAHTSVRLERAEFKQSKRLDWLEVHADLVAELQVVRRAERARETQVRVAAINSPDVTVQDLLGPEPTVQRQRLRWRRAVEATPRSDRVRNPEALPTAGDATNQLLGARPNARHPAREYHLAASAVDAVVTATVPERRRNLDVDVEL